MYLSRNTLFGIHALAASTTKSADKNIFDALKEKYSSLTPIITAKYGAFPKPFQWIYSDDDFSRTDEDNDFEFYAQERLVHHIDETARNALTGFYRTIMKHELSRLSAPTLHALDICTSWVTHYPPEMLTDNLLSAKGIGMNRVELASNPAFKTKRDYLVQDLNANPVISEQFAPNESFDIVTIAVSIDYLINTTDLLKEMLRMLKPDGLLVLSFSNRMFWNKAIKIWTQASERKRVWIACSFVSYFYDDGNSQRKEIADEWRFDQFDAYRIDDADAAGKHEHDPMYVVIARKKAASCDSE